MQCFRATVDRVRTRFSEVTTDEFQQQAYAQRLKLEDAYHGYVHLEENNFAHKKHYL